MSKSIMTLAMIYCTSARPKSGPLHVDQGSQFLYVLSVFMSRKQMKFICMILFGQQIWSNMHTIFGQYMKIKTGT